MGRRGPKRTPTGILEQRGSRPQQDRDGEVLPVALAPVRPDWLLPEALKAWDYLAPKLERLGLLTEIDLTAFSRYCQIWARWRQAEEFLKKAGGSTYVDKRLTYQVVREFPQVRQSQRYAALLVKLEAEFGLTPSGRASLNVGGNDPFADDPLYEMLKRRSESNEL